MAQVLNIIQMDLNIKENGKIILKMDFLYTSKKQEKL